MTEGERSEWHKSRWAILGLMLTVATAILGGGIAWGTLSESVSQVKKAVEPIAEMGEDVRELKARASVLEQRAGLRDQTLVDLAKSDVRRSDDVAAIRADVAAIRAEQRAMVGAIERLIRLSDEERRLPAPPARLPRGGP